MKHAILIICGEEYKRLPCLVRQFDNRFNIYIHVDSKVMVPIELLEGLRDMDNVRLVAQVYKTNWGCMGLVDAILYLCNESAKNISNSHFHLISGSDFPVASNGQIFKQCQTEEDNFIEFFPLPTLRWLDGGLSRLWYFHPLDELDFRSPIDHEIYCNFVECQRRLGVKRKLLDIPYYGGSTWWSLSRKCIEYIVNNKDRNNLYAHMQNTYIPDEMFVQTLLLNSPLKDSLKNNNMRYVVWRIKNGHIPANLDMDDYENILRSKSLFMRKTDKDVSEDLVNKIAQYRNSY